MNRSKSVKSDVRLRYVKAARKNWVFGFQRGLVHQRTTIEPSTRQLGFPA